MTDGSVSQAEDKAQLEIDAAIEAESKALTEATQSIKALFEPLTQNNKFIILQELQTMARADGSRLY